jgi:hypothetical protein
VDEEKTVPARARMATRPRIPRAVRYRANGSRTRGLIILRDAPEIAGRYPGGRPSASGLREVDVEAPADENPLQGPRLAGGGQISTELVLPQARRGLHRSRTALGWIERSRVLPTIRSPSGSLIAVPSSSARSPHQTAGLGRQSTGAERPRPVGMMGARPRSSLGSLGPGPPRSLRADDRDERAPRRLQDLESP